MSNPIKKFDREAVLRFHPLSQIKTSATAQRDLNPSRVDRILANLDLEQIGTPTVNQRPDESDAVYVIDGQHRIAALRAFFEDDPDIKVQCWTYFGLTEEQEAERFLKLNDTLTVSAFAKFRVGVTAGREVESDIDRIVRANGCVVSQDALPGAIGAVGALVTIYTRTGAANLARTINVVHGSFGDTGLENSVLLGVAFALDRYGKQIDDTRLVNQLGRMARGAKALVEEGERYRLRTGNLKSHCIAAAVVDAYNAGLGPRAAKRVLSWWKDAE